MERYDPTLFENHDVDDIVLAIVMAEYGQYAVAVEAGFTITQDEVNTIVERYRKAYALQREHGGTVILLPDPITGELVKTYIHRDDYRLALIDTLGDRYWNEVLPEQIRREEVTSQWRLTYLEGVEDLDEIGRIVNELARNTLHDLTVEVTGEIEIDATVEDAIVYALAWDRFWVH